MESHLFYAQKVKVTTSESVFRQNVIYCHCCCVRKLRWVFPGVGFCTLVSTCFEASAQMATSRKEERKEKKEKSNCFFYSCIYLHVAHMNTRSQHARQRIVLRWVPLWTRFYAVLESDSSISPETQAPSLQFSAGWWSNRPRPKRPTDDMYHKWQNYYDAL